MVVYHGSYCLIDNPYVSFSRDALDFGKDEALKKLQYYKPNHQICIINQEIINKYLKYEGCKEV